MCIKPHDEHFWNKLRRFVKLDVMKRIYFYECGTQINTKERFLVPELMYNHALSLVKSNELHYAEVAKSLTDCHQNRMGKLNRYKESLSKGIEGQEKDATKEEIKEIRKEMKEITSKLHEILKLMQKTSF